MKNIFILTALFAFAILANASSQSLNCERVVDYTMQVSLDVENKLVEGSQRLIWKNTGRVATNELYFHLYLNAFKNTKSTFMTEALRRSSSPGYLRQVMDGGWGYCEVSNITLVEPETQATVSLIESFEFVQPDDDNTDDETVFRVTLPSAVAPQDSVVLDMSFVSKLPHRAPRAGYYQDFFFVAQWFPKIGVWQDGTWNAHQFHASSEFFADYGTYDVSITVPQEFIVGASGVQTDSTAQQEGTITYRFQQHCIHDFAWTAYPEIGRAHV